MQRRRDTLCFRGGSTKPARTRRREARSPAAANDIEEKESPMYPPLVDGRRSRLGGGPLALALVVAIAACGRTGLLEVAAGDAGRAGGGGARAGGGAGGGGGAGAGGAGGFSGVLPDARVVPQEDAAVPDGPDPIGAEPRPIPPPVATCPAPPPMVRPRHAFQLSAKITADPTTMVKSFWQIAATPPGSRAATLVSAGPDAIFTPDVAGDYRLRFQVADDRGRSDSCDVTVPVRAMAPIAVCPAGATVLAGEVLELRGDGKDDDGPTTFAWRVEGRPPGADATVAPADAAVTRFRASRGGNYTVVLAVKDLDGLVAECKVAVRVTEAPRVVCPQIAKAVVRNRAVVLAAQATDDERVVETSWRVLLRPRGSFAEPSPATALTTTFTPDRLGDYSLEFTARDADGLQGRCETRLTAIGEAPTLSCPAVETRPLRDTTVFASATDNGMIVRWNWELVVAPPGSAARPMFTNDPKQLFRPDIAGVYTFLVSAFDDEGLAARCNLIVRAAADEGLRIEMSWNNDGTDMDLHLLSPKGTHWLDIDTNQDCHYQNCKDTDLDWGDPTRTEDNPHLDIDDTDGFGPENINIDRPAPGVYRVGVHAYGGDGVQVMVRLYCGGSRLEPRATFGPVGLQTEQFWRVADVEIFMDGHCEVRSLALQPSGAPYLSTTPDAEMKR
jgi:hypothetical protein